MNEIFKDRQRAESFGTDAQRYDRTRPTYPDELVDWLTGDEPGRSVDVGCGTGQLARPLQDRGWDVVGVEIDERMVLVAQSHGLRVDVSAFEDWEGAGPFDLVTSAQAWHWIDPMIGYKKAAGLLRPRGRLALVWNSYHYDDSISEVFSDVFGRHAPVLLQDSVPLGTIDPDYERLDEQAVLLMGSAFEIAEPRVFEHERTQTIEAWLDEALTHSPVSGLEPGVRGPLLEELAVRLKVVSGGSLRVAYRARVTSAIRV